MGGTSEEWNKVEEKERTGMGGGGSGRPGSSSTSRSSEANGEGVPSIWIFCRRRGDCGMSKWEGSGKINWRRGIRGEGTGLESRKVEEGEE